MSNRNPGWARGSKACYSENMIKKYAMQGVAVGLALVLLIFLGRVFSGRILLPQTFAIGNFELRYYGLILAAAIVAAYAVARKRLDRYKISVRDADDLLFYALISGFIGARIYHILSDIQFYIHKPVEIFMVWHGGLSIYGAVIGGAFGAWLYYRAAMRRAGTSIKFLAIADWLTPSLLVGQIIGRFGNFFNYELFGYPTNVPWKMYVPLHFRPPEYLSSAYFHPLFLYEALANGLILIFILRRQNKKSRPGTLFFSYVLLYNIVRLLLEFMRVDSVRLFGLRQNALVSLVLALAAAGYLIYHSHNETSIPQAG